VVALPFQWRISGGARRMCRCISVLTRVQGLDDPVTCELYFSITSRCLFLDSSSRRTV
jgi:hypothetical protein